MRIIEAKTLFPQADDPASRLIPEVLHEAGAFGVNFFPAVVPLAVARLSSGSAARKQLHSAFGDGSTFDDEYDILFEYISGRMPLTDSHAQTQQMLATGRFFASLRQFARESVHQRVSVHNLLVSAMGSMDPVLADFFEESGRGIANVLLEMDVPPWVVYPSFDYGVPTP